MLGFSVCADVYYLHSKVMRKLVADMHDEELLVQHGVEINSSHSMELDYHNDTGPGSWEPSL